MALSTSQPVANLSRILNNMDTILRRAEFAMSRLLAHLDSLPQYTNRNDLITELNEKTVINKDSTGFHNCTRYEQECINGSIGSGIDTMVNDSSSSASTNISSDSVRYYVEGVILVPLCIFGFFGKKDYLELLAYRNR